MSIIAFLAFRFSSSLFGTKDPLSHSSVSYARGEIWTLKKTSVQLVFAYASYALPFCRYSRVNSNEFSCNIKLCNFQRVVDLNDWQLSHSCVTIIWYPTPRTLLLMAGAATAFRRATETKPALANLHPHEFLVGQSLLGTKHQISPSERSPLEI